MGTLASLKSPVIALLPDLTVGTAINELGKLNAMAVIWFQGVRGQVLASNHQRQDIYGCYNGHQSQSHNQNTLTHVDLWHWLIGHGVSRNEIESLLNSYLVCTNRKVLGQVHKSNPYPFKQFQV